MFLSTPQASLKCPSSNSYPLTSVSLVTGIPMDVKNPQISVSPFKSILGPLLLYVMKEYSNCMFTSILFITKTLKKLELMNETG